MAAEQANAVRHLTHGQRPYRLHDRQGRQRKIDDAGYLPRRLGDGRPQGHRLCPGGRGRRCSSAAPRASRAIRSRGPSCDWSTAGSPSPETTSWCSTRRAWSPRSPWPRLCGMWKRPGPSWCWSAMPPSSKPIGAGGPFRSIAQRVGQCELTQIHPPAGRMATADRRAFLAGRGQGSVNGLRGPKAAPRDRDEGGGYQGPG